ncbi:uncharacterized protein LOC132394131 isoform X1 [Hypanus sabinus]|uniref:uncharacterized protein LOC132394131 isoform X1 n=1 Tax=Hypanus sabinus TaxID=79690 RepID=UPI0028C4B358|nr:uncharacterized protein LOC132394131 isoform X1 [Hypanus sabinus]
MTSGRIERPLTFQACDLSVQNIDILSEKQTAGETLGHAVSWREMESPLLLRVPIAIPFAEIRNKAGNLVDCPQNCPETGEYFPQNKREEKIDLLNKQQQCQQTT